MSARTTQIILVIGALILFVLLFIAPKIAPPKTGGNSENGTKQQVSADNNASIEIYKTLAIKNLEPNQAKLLNQLENEKKTDSLVMFWDKLKRPDIAAVYVEQKALSAKDSSMFWFKAGDRYYYSIQFTQDKTEVPLLYQCAMRCYSKGLKINPRDTDSRIMLASCFVEGTQDPMQGISMMREIEKTDSNNVKLQLSFAFFSVKSGQLDKAITRFKKVLAVDSNYIEAYLHLADAYEQLGKTENTIEVLKKYGAKTTDVTAKVEIAKYIEQLKGK